MALKRSAIPRPTLAKETVNVPELGGEVVIHAPLLSDHLAVIAREKHEKPAETLARAVRDDEGEPVFSFEEWEIFGAQHPDVVTRLLEVSRRLAVGAAEKKAAAPS